MAVGDGGQGTFNQVGGTVTASEWVGMAQQPGSIAAYDLQDGSIQTPFLCVGNQGAGTFTQSGGSITLTQANGGLVLGDSAGSDGTYTLSGTGQLAAEYECVGYRGAGAFIQTGGANTVAGALDVGCNAGSTGAYTISAGTLNVRDLYVGHGGSGVLSITGAAAQVTVSGQMEFGAGSTFSAVPGAAIHMTGADFYNQNTDPASLGGLANLNLVFEGGPAVTDYCEVACHDYGPDTQGYTDNFALGALHVGGAEVGKVCLADWFDNIAGGADALYVMNLTVGPACELDLSGLHLYHLNAVIDPAAVILGGSVIPVPALAGDADLNGEVALPDLSILAFHWQMTWGATWAHGDFDGDGGVALSDLSILAFHWGETMASAPPVPEPCGLALLAIGALAVLRRRRR